MKVNTVKEQVRDYIRANDVQECADMFKLEKEVLHDTILDTKCRKSTALKKLKQFLREESLRMDNFIPEDKISGSTFLNPRRYALMWWYMVFAEVGTSRFYELCNGPELYGELLHLTGDYYINHTDEYYTDLEIAKEFLKQMM